MSQSAAPSGCFSKIMLVRLCADASRESKNHLRLPHLLQVLSSNSARGFWVSSSLRSFDDMEDIRAGGWVAF